MKSNHELMLGTALLLASSVLCSGCDDALKDVYLIEEPRVLGARVEVEGDPSRATPGPGESATVRWLVAGPATEPEPLLGWELSVCEALPPGSALPACALEPFASASAEEPVSGAPALTFTVPAEPSSDALAVLGTICPGASPASCQGDIGRQVSLDFTIAGELANQNPSIHPELLSFDGEPWAEGTACGELPEVSAKSQHAIAVVLQAEDAEPVVPVIESDPTREMLQVSHFATRGELDHTFTVFGDDDVELVSRVEWIAPGGVTEPLTARLFFVVRDDRGGTDWVERSVCVVP